MFGHDYYDHYGSGQEVILSNYHKPIYNSDSARQARLSSDGELPDLDTLLDSADEQPPENESLAYCIHCGSANPGHARYCAKCGQALLDADAFNAGREKVKRTSRLQAESEPDLPTHASAPQSRSWGLSYAFTAITRLGAIAAMTLMTLFSDSRWLIFLPLLTGFLVEAVRGHKRYTENMGSALVEFVTAMAVTGLYAALLYATSGGLGTVGLLSLIMLFWFLIEALRG